MLWRNLSIILACKQFSESDKIVTVFNKNIGKTSGMFRGSKCAFQLGDVSDISWRGKSIDHLGSIKIENIFSPFRYAFNNSIGMFALESACALCMNCMPDHVPHQELFESLKAFLLSMVSTKENWLERYVFFEISLLKEIGYGLNLEKCAVTGKTEGLCYVSPKTGCAVTEEVGHRYRDKLFPLPQFIIQDNESPENDGPTERDISCALDISGHFLKMYLGNTSGKELPFSRKCLSNYI
jgi:DNA repair protein RecO (recombination protein O)